MSALVRQSSIEGRCFARRLGFSAFSCARILRSDPMRARKRVERAEPPVQNDALRFQQLVDNGQEDSASLLRLLADNARDLMIYRCALVPHGLQL
jgi:hypothetical protein